MTRDRQAIARRRLLLLWPVFGPVFFAVGLRQTVAGRGAGDAAQGVPRSNAVRRQSLLFAVGLAAAFALASWAWIHWALPPHGSVGRIVASLVAGDLASSLVFWPWVVISADISQRLEAWAHRGRSDTR